ncbi:hypothetical protein HGRIS_009117 [Hohenbuehelia grisea]|uniref:Uncharacterized protein n=1 Tax=Hohenbuehelia grisea TaxID=104357 RepID=A0ABR3J0L0_9AGAR
MPDAFANCSNFNIHGGTFTNVAGDQNNTVTTYYNYHIFPGALAPHSTFHRTQNTGPPLPLPSTSPYKELVHVIEEIQRALSPLEELYSDTRPLVSLFGPLKAQLGELFQSAAFVGSVVELLETIKYFNMPDYLLLQVKSRVAHYTSALTMFLGDIKRYRDGLRDAAVGPSWLRILWFILRAARDPGIEAILFDMKCEVDQFQTPLKQFLAVLQRMDLDINSRRLAPVNREAIHSLLGILKSGLPLFKDVILEFVTVAVVDKGKYIHVPLLWCSSMQDVVAACEKIAAQTPRSWHDASSELLHKDLRGLSFASITPGTIVKCAFVAYGVVFYDDIPNLCPACRSSLDPYEAPCTSWVECRYCGMEYSLRIDEHANAGNVTRHSSPWSMGYCVSEGSLTDKITFHFPSLFRQDQALTPWSCARRISSEDLLAPGSVHPPPRTLVHFSRSWAHLIRSHVITGLAGELSYLISVLKCLFRLRSPLQQCSIILDGASFKFVHSNLVIPEGLLNHTLSSTSSAPVPNLTLLSMDFRRCRCHSDDTCMLTSLGGITLPSLVSLHFRSAGARKCCYDTLELFVSRTRSLQTLRLEICPELPRAYFNMTTLPFLNTFIRCAAPVLSNLTSLTIEYSGIPWRDWEYLFNPCVLRSLYHAWKETRRLVMTSIDFRLVNSFWAHTHKFAYPSPWVLLPRHRIGDDQVAELSLDELDNYIGFGIDAYDIFESFLLSRPFDHPDLQSYDSQICPEPSTGAHFLTYEACHSDFRSRFPTRSQRVRARKARAKARKEAGKE